MIIKLNIKMLFNLLGFLESHRQRFHILLVVESICLLYQGLMSCLDGGEMMKVNWELD